MLPHIVRRALRRIEREDVLVLIIALGITWYATEYLQGLVATWHPMVSASWWLPHAASALVVSSLWLVWGHRLRVLLEHRWPKAWNSITVVTEFMTHTTPELLYKLLFSSEARPPPRVRYPVTMTFPATLRDKLEANRIARSEWSGDTPNIFADVEWHLRNPNTMGIARDRKGIAVGYFDFAPVGKDFLQQLRAGTVNEFDLAEVILPDDHSCSSLRRAEVIYVAGIVSRAFKSTWDRQKIGAFLHWSMARILSEAVFGADETRRVLFVAVAYGGDDSDGAKFCERANMTKVGHVVVDGDPRGEKHTWYELETSLYELKRGNARLRRILKDESGSRLEVDVRESTLTKQVYVLHKAGSEGRGPQ